MSTNFLRAYPPQQPAAGRSLWFPFQAGNIYMLPYENGFAPLRGDETRIDNIDSIDVIEYEEAYYLGTLDGVPCMTCEIKRGTQVPVSWQAVNLRSLYGQVLEQYYMLAGYASQILSWQRDSGYCPRSGDAMEPIANTWGKRCPSCGYTHFPPVTPAILAIVQDEQERILMTHQKGWGDRYGLIAGFVEPGESLEECVRREVREEAGIEIAEVSYLGNQTWPFPHQLMVGFSAHYKSGTVQADLDELDDVKWFGRDALPTLPPRVSLARKMIDTWLHEKD
jgi:NAD+ diphosphatase